MLQLLRRPAVLACLLLAALPALASRPAPTVETPQTAVDGLLATDRSFAAASAGKGLVDGLSAMFADDIVMTVPGRFARGKAEVRDYLLSNSDHATSRIEWAPQRGGVSADGLHGFTFGYMTLRKPDQSTQPMKYLAYWIKREGTWRVVVYKRTRANAAPGSAPALPPALPARLQAATADPARIQDFARSLDQAERAFSDEAQKIGLGAAFAKYGSSDAVNLGGPDDAHVVLGADKIAEAVSAGSAPNTSPVTWAPDEVIVASSGDLGITVGFLQPNGAAADGSRKPIPFFTIWRRPDTAAPWRYVAE